MSTVERNKGTLVFTADGEKAATLYNKAVDEERDHQFILTTAGKLYKIDCTIEAELDCSHFVEVEGEISSDQNLDFHTLHYNGGGDLKELLEHELTRKLKL